MSQTGDGDGRHQGAPAPGAGSNQANSKDRPRTVKSRLSRSLSQVRGSVPQRTRTRYPHLRRYRWLVTPRTGHTNSRGQCPLNSRDGARAPERRMVMELALAA